MSLIYGEGQQKALARLQRKILRTSQFKGSVTAQNEAVGRRSHTVDPASVIENNLPWNSDGAESPCRHPQSIPNVIVGIDFGLTHTAVCWSEGPEWCEPQIIRQWPRSGASRRTLTDKVKTAVGYDDNGVLVNWGLESGNDDKMIVTEEYFKIYLDPAFHDNHPSRPTFRESLRFYEDFMRSLYLHIDLYLREQMTDYDERSIEFLLSIPTSWERLPFVSTLQQYLDSLDLKKHWSRIYLTEAEAVAVNLAEVYIAGDTLMVVDAGGATTDINALRVLDFAETVIGLRSLSQAEAINAGSMLVDECMRGILRSRLQDLGVSCDSSNLARIADDTLRAKPFEPIKCTFSGSPTQIDCDIVFTIPADAGYGIGNRRVIVTGRELKEVFDSQIQLIAGKIDEQLFKLQQEYSSSVDYIILAGGLGSSTYVLRMLKARFPKHKILCVDKPRLAVANGLVRNRILELREEAIRQLWSKEGSEDGSSDKTPLGISVESSTVSTEGLVRTVISRISTPN